jgi:glycosyltransferase involved in cell wall biosynthesis
MRSTSPGRVSTSDVPHERSRPLRILLAHNFYREPGGEDAVFRSERDLLQGAGHHVYAYTKENSKIESGTPHSIAVACGTIWSHATYRSLHRLLATERPDVAHFHNIFPLLSPSAYEACRDARVPVIQTLHNYRLFCPAASFFRSGKVCEECTDHSLWRSVQHGCYRGSRAATATVASMLAIHGWRGTWRERVDCFVALTEFAREKLIQLGLPAEKIAVKPNFVDPDPGLGEGEGGFALFVGRLSPEKGIRTLLDAWRKLDGRTPLKILGDGPDAPLVRDAASRLRDVEWLGWRPNAEVLRLIGEATFLVFPSEWYEACPRVLIECLARGTPVLATSLGAAAELIRAGRTGLHFQPGDADELALQADRMVSDVVERSEFRREARREYERKYTAERNYTQLMSIYQKAQAARA